MLLAIIPPFLLCFEADPVSTPELQRGETDFFSGEPLRALSTLVFSENIDLQRSASLTFAEITERGMPCRRTAFAAVSGAATQGR